MSFATYLDGLRERPEHVHKRVAFWTSFGITAVIAAFWASSFSIALPTNTANVAVQEAAAKAGSPGSSMIAGVGQFADDIWTMITGPKQVKFSEVQVTPGRK